MKPNNRATSKQLARIVREIAKARAGRSYPSLFRVFLLVAASGDVPRAKRILAWMYAVPPTRVATALSTDAIDAFCAAAELGDVTKGLPYFGPPRDDVPPLRARVAAAEGMIRERVLRDAFSGAAPKNDGWQKQDPTDRMTWVARWRRIQAIARQGTKTAEQDALARLDAYLRDIPPGQRFTAGGDELALALDLAYRHEGEVLVGAWLAKHGARLVEAPFLLETALCFRAVAAKMVQGVLREAIGLSTAEIEAALRAIEKVVGAAPMQTQRSQPPPKIQKRRVSCSYSQVHLEPAELTAKERAQVHFQKRNDAKKGMSLFPTMVGIGTPSDTAYVDAEITVALAAKPAVRLDGVTQAVTFPLAVRGPLRLTSVDSAGDEEPIVIPSGTYDVLARFVPKTAPRGSAKAGLRVFKLELAFHAQGVLEAPRTLRLEA
ncbi:MAG: hypothetical protein SFX73_32795 [Kofleriaceae bacterium]|nr:hypothetical protein [Kofleriaceae bacterium]